MNRKATSEGHLSVSIELEDLKCSACAADTPAPISDNNLYSRGFFFANRDEDLEPLRIEVDVRSLSREVNSTTFTYRLSAVLETTCPSCRSNPPGLKELASIPIQAFHELAICPRCGTQGELTIERAELTEMSDVTDRVTVVGSVRCHTCANSHYSVCRRIRIAVRALVDAFNSRGSKVTQLDESMNDSGAAVVSRPIRLFYSYSHRDENSRRELEKHLTLLRRSGVIDEWHDRRIEPGVEWKREISENLASADIILLLISADFLASDYCYEVEMQKALDLHRVGAARVIPIILRAVDWSCAPFSHLQALPRDGRAVALWPDKDQAFTDIAVSIRSVVDSMSFGRDRR